MAWPSGSRRVPGPPRRGDACTSMTGPLNAREMVWGAIRSRAEREEVEMLLHAEIGRLPERFRAAGGTLLSGRADL